ncbi:hypothetical protein ONZ45_g17891 [Pleurotus djamor]|nr:hypothetical protein ONZ45_g17891 [Pleurotus djamor]
MLNPLLALIVLAIVGSVSLASTASAPQPELPDCSKGCLDGSKAPMCTDNPEKICFCKSEAFMKSAVDCSKLACSKEDFDTAEWVASVICGPMWKAGGVSVANVTSSSSSSVVESSSATPTSTSLSLNAAQRASINDAQAYVAIALSGLLVLAL